MLIIRIFKFYILVLLIFLCGEGKILSQEKKELNDSIELNSQYFLNANLHNGLVINNYIYYDSFPSRNPSNLFELKIGKQTIGKKPWQQHYNFPLVGLSLIGGNLGNNNELGYTVGLVPNVTLNAISQNKWSLKVTLGSGIAYFNKPYNIHTNNTNILIGSHITNMSILQFYFRKAISSKTDINFGLSGIHSSNGHYQLPNVGLNMITAQIGLMHYFDKRPTTFFTDSSYLNRSKKLKYGFRLGLGMHEFGNELGPVGGSKYTIADLSFYLKRSAGKLGSALIGLGYKHYTSRYENIVEDTLFSTNLHLKSSVFTFFLGYEFEMGQISLLVQGGINVYNPYCTKINELTENELSIYDKLSSLVSTRLGLQYYFLNPEKYRQNMYLGLYIKANMGSADFVSLSTGFLF